MNIIIEVTDIEYKALQYVAHSPDDWSENAVKNRARIAVDEIVVRLVQHCNANNISIAKGSEKQINQAYDLGIVKTARQRQKEVDLEREAAQAYHLNLIEKAIDDKKKSAG